MRANVPFFDLSARNSTPICSSKCRQTMENKVTFILVQPFCPSASSNGAPPSLSFPPSLPLIREKRIFEMETEEKVSPSSRQKCTTNSFLAYTQTKKKHHVYFSRDGGESKRGVRSVHYTKVESAIESLLSRKAALYSGSRGENQRYTGVIPLSLGAFSIPASIRNSL